MTARIKWAETQLLSQLHAKPEGDIRPGTLRRLPLTVVARSIQPYGFVYVFAARELVKIGMTRDSIYRRWHQIKVGNPWLERPLYVSPPLLGKVVEVERACHAALKQYRITGEWFQCDRALALETVQTLVARFTA